jgi:enoyl-CoA hydratase
VDADEALRIGLVNAVHDPPLEKALETAHVLASKGPLALAAAKAAINRALAGDPEGNLAAEADDFGELFASEDAKEGLAAFVEKRAPTFVGR